MVLVVCFASFSIGSTNCYFNTKVLSHPLNVSAWVSDIWITTNTSEFNAGVPLNVNTSNNEVKLNRTMTGSIPYIYGLSGGNSLNFNRYNFSTLLWQPRANTLHPINYGGALTYDYQGGNYLYALAGGGTTNFTRYSISANSWTGRANTLVPISYGGALAYAQGFVYALAGGNTNNFTRYNPLTNTWTGRANTLSPINAGGSLAYAGGNFIYALAGGGTTNFTRYNISANKWEGRASTPGSIYDGGAITWDGGNFLYALSGGSGGGGKGFYRYSISANTWAILTDTPNPTKAGGAITSDKGNFIYFFQGGITKFWRYTISPTPAFTELANNPISVGWGGSLVYVPGVSNYCYSSPGTIASIVFDTTTTGSRWDVLAWNATLPSGTSITFHVRASNTLFDKNVVTPPAWTPVTGTLVGGTYYVYYPALPVGRYLQWRATLTSSVCANTPVLHDVTVYYTDP
jgi:hypothetical protein